MKGLIRVLVNDKQDSWKADLVCGGCRSTVAMDVSREDFYTWAYGRRDDDKLPINNFGLCESCYKSYVGKLDERIASVLRGFGISNNLQGFYFFKEGIKIVLQNPSLTGGIYKAIMKVTGYSYSQVESSLRYSLRVSIKSVKSNTRLREYSDAGRRNPSALRLIREVASDIREEENDILF